MRLLLILLLLWVGGFAYYYSLIHPLPEDGGQACEALVVLTGSAGRVEAGFELLEAGRAKHLFITGVGDDRHSEAFLESYKPSDALRAKVTQSGALTIDRAATSTFENAEETAKWLDEAGYSRLCLVTAQYHMPRSLLVFKSAMPEKTWIPIGVKGWDVRPEQLWQRTDLAFVLLREYHKWFYVFISHWLGR